MDKENKHIEDFFHQNKEALNTERMNSGHSIRFLEKLKASKKPVKKLIFLRSIAVAASIVISLGLVFINRSNGKITEERFSPSIEIAEAHQYYDHIITNKTATIKSFKNSDNTILISDAIKELNNLKQEEEDLLKQLSENKNYRIVNALLTNYNIRIQLLEQVSQQITSINQLKNGHYENHL